MDLIHDPQWISVIKWAKNTGKLYIVHEVQKEKCFHLKILSLNVGKYFYINKIAENVLWNSIKIMRIEHENPF